MLEEGYCLLSQAVSKYFLILLFDSSYRCPWHQYVTRSRKSYFDCELDISADSAKSAVHACKKCLTLASYVPKLQSFKFHTRAYLGLEIITVYFSPVAKRPDSPYTTGSRYTCTMFSRLSLRNRAAANGHGDSPSHLCQRVAALVAGRLLLRLHKIEVRQWGLSACT